MGMTEKYSVFIFLIIATTVLANENGPEITIEQGSLLGKTQTTRNGRLFSAFTGIPYAKPPVGQLRFKAPEPADPWEGVFDATRPHAICPQYNPFTKNYTVVGDEDCLYLNVYTPQLPDGENEPLPVMFFIHGGGWQFGSAGSDLYGADLLLDKDIVLVTANYRLGVLGFATLGNDLLPGNNGLKDQALAIKWIRNNIANFGGDPDKITVSGQSAGAASAHYHMLSPRSRKLINGVIAQSGNALSIWALAPGHIVGIRTKVVAGFVNCPAYKDDEMLECLMDVNAHELVQETTRLLETDLEPLPLLFKPVMEPPLKGAFLTQDPLDIIKSGKAADIPFMTGITTEDGAIRTASIFKAPEVLKDLNKKFIEVAPVILTYTESAQIKTKDKISKQIRKFYFGDEPIDDSAKASFTKMYTDGMFLMGADTSVEMHAKYQTKPIYYYLFGYRGSASFCDSFDNPPQDYGVCHSDDLLYLYKMSMFPNSQTTETDEKVTDLMTTLWANFVTYGNPTPKTDSTISVKWEPVQTGKQNYYHIKSDSDVELKEGLYKERAMFWRNLPIDSRRVRVRDEL